MLLHGGLLGAAGVASGGGSPPSYVLNHTATQAYITSSYTLTLTTTPTVGNLLVVCVSSYSYATGDVTVADNKGNSYTKQTSVGASTYAAISIWTAPVTTSGGTFTLTITMPNTGGSNEQFSSAVAAEVSGQSASFLDAYGASTSTSTAVAATAMGDLTASNDLVIGAMTRVGQSGTVTPNANWTQIAEIDEANSATFCLSAIYRVPGASGAYDPAWTLSSSDQWLAAGIAIKGAA